MLKRLRARESEGCLVPDFVRTEAIWGIGTVLLRVEGGFRVVSRECRKRGYRKGATCGAYYGVGFISESKNYPKS